MQFGAQEENFKKILDSRKRHNLILIILVQPLKSENKVQQFTKSFGMYE